MPPAITDRFPPLPIDEIIALIDAFPKMAASWKIAFIRRLTAIHLTYNVDWVRDQFIAVADRCGKAKCLNM